MSIYPKITIKIKKTIPCPVCGETVVIRGNRKMHPWCSLDVQSKRNNSYKRSKLLEKRYVIDL